VVKGATATGLDINTLSLPLLTSVPQVMTDSLSVYTMVRELTDSLMEFPLTDDQVKYIVEQPLMGGSPYYDWMTIWNDYVKTPTNAMKKSDAKTRLDRMMNYILRLAEYQMG
jgi:hypothetical protein